MCEDRQSVTSLVTVTLMSEIISAALECFLQRTFQVQKSVSKASIYLAISLFFWFYSDFSALFLQAPFVQLTDTQLQLYWDEETFTSPRRAGPWTFLFSAEEIMLLINDALDWRTDLFLLRSSKCPLIKPPKNARLIIFWKWKRRVSGDLLFIWGGNMSHWRLPGRNGVVAFDTGPEWSV